MKYNKERTIILAELRRKYGDVCWYCGRKISNEITIDHIIPQSRGGTDDKENLALACNMCNRAKFCYDVIAFLQWISHLRSGHFQCRMSEVLKEKLTQLDPQEQDRLQKSYYEDDKT